MLELDGSFGEGGGQILRTSLALSLVTSQAFHLRNVRAKRSKPGLQPQHLMSVRAAAQVGQARVRGDQRGSTDLIFEPGAVTPGNHHFAIGTAGATGLVLHTIYLPLALAAAPSELTIDGGTHVDHSPCYHFLETTWCGYMRLLGLRIDVTMGRPGFYPRGGGMLRARVEPCAAPCAAPRALQLTEWPAATEISGFSAVAGLPDHIRARQGRRATERLQERGLKVSLREETWPGGPGTVVALTAHTLPVPTLFFALGARGKPAERVADQAVDQLAAFLDAPRRGLDLHSADQLLLPLALAPGPSHFATTQITLHLVTNAEVIRRFVDRDIHVTGPIGEPGTVTVS